MEHFFWKEVLHTLLRLLIQKKRFELVTLIIWVNVPIPSLKKRSIYRQTPTKYSLTQLLQCVLTEIYYLVYTIKKVNDWNLVLLHFA